MYMIDIMIPRIKSDVIARSNILEDLTKPGRYPAIDHSAPVLDYHDQMIVKGEYRMIVVFKNDRHICDSFLYD